MAGLLRGGQGGPGMMGDQSPGGMGGQSGGMGGGKPMAPGMGEDTAPGGGADGDISGEQPNVTPEEQAQYDQFVNNAFSIIYDKKVFPSILQRLKATPDPVEGLASVTVMVISFLQTTARQQHTDLSPDVLLHGGMAILEDLAETAGKAGVHDYTPKEIEAATYRAVDMYREMEQQAGGLHREAMQRDWQALVQANQSGELDKAMPGLAQHFADVQRQGGDNAQEEGAEPSMPMGRERMEERGEGRRGLMPMMGGR